MKKFVLLLVLILVPACHSALADASAASNPLVAFETNQGRIEMELYPDKAPESVKNFLQYVKDGFYNGAIFHRVIRSFMIQGGGFTSKMEKKPTRAPIQNEADNGLKNLKYTAALARTMDPNSATSQFFINTKDNPFLDHKAKNPRGWGYCVFGKVVKGMAVVDAIESVKTTIKGQYRDVPEEPVIILKAEVIKAKP
ncbi:MAG: peptidyl-prolyl cis-trans isomerase [Desulfobacterales bacterium]|nr:peptidyl-prolyl cis-trans isomerase [Desulfobacterales bacterium]